MLDSLIQILTQIEHENGHRIPSQMRHFRNQRDPQSVVNPYMGYEHAVNAVLDRSLQIHNLFQNTSSKART